MKEKEKTMKLTNLIFILLILLANIKLQATSKEDFYLKYKIENILFKKVHLKRIKENLSKNKNTSKADDIAYIPDIGDSLNYKIIDTIRDMKIKNSLIVAVYIGYSTSNRYDDLFEMNGRDTFYLGTKRGNTILENNYKFSYYFRDEILSKYRRDSPSIDFSHYNKYNFNPDNIIIMFYDTTIAKSTDFEEWCKSVKFISGTRVELDDIEDCIDTSMKDLSVIDYIYYRYRNKIYNKSSIKHIGASLFEVSTKNIYIPDKQNEYYNYISKDNQVSIEDEDYYPTEKFYISVKFRDDKIVFIEN
jgi:hypothetical protein